MVYLLVAHIFITLALIGIILIQRSDSNGLSSFGGGGNAGGGLLSARGTANLLTRTTMVLASLFIGNCLLMTFLSNKKIQSDIQITTIPKAVEVSNSLPPLASSPSTSPSTPPSSVEKKNNKNSFPSGKKEQKNH
jgi:preprotein translocase subunit SecG